MMSFKLYLFIGIVLFTLLVACESQVDLNLEEPETELVIISNFTPNQPVTVQVSKTRSPLNTEDSVYLDNATVSLYQGNKLLEFLELVPATDQTPPYYTTRQTMPSVGVQYTIRAEAPGFAAVSATSSVPNSTSIRSLRLSDIDVFPAEGGRQNYLYQVAVVFDDPGEGQNFYHLNFYQQILAYRLNNSDTIITDTWLQQIRFSSELDDNSLIAYFRGGVLFDDQSFNGKPISYAFPLQVSINPRRELIGKMFVELRTVSKEYYLFHNSLSRQQTSSNGPFSEPVMIYNNIENGQGIFAGYNAAVDSVAIQF